MKRMFSYIPRILLYVIMFGLAFIFLYPFIYMIVTSLKTNDDLYNYLVKWVPSKLNFKNYLLAINITRYWNNLKNSLFVTTIAILGQTMSCSMTGYALARFKFPGKRVLFLIVIFAMLIPSSTIIVPQYLMYGNINWLNTYYPLTVPAFFGYGINGALYIYIFMQFYKGFPKEIEEAARVDGCGFLRIFLKIVFPTVSSSYLVVVVFSMVFNWSSTFEPSMFISKTDMSLVSGGLKNLAYTLTMPPDVMNSSFGITDENALNNAVLMAACFLVVIPILTAFIFLQKKFIEGIVHSGLTGE